jgi:hypothetical protein
MEGNIKIAAAIISSVAPDPSRFVGVQWTQHGVRRTRRCVRRTFCRVRRTLCRTAASRRGSAGATEEMIAAAVKASGEFPIPHSSPLRKYASGRARKPTVIGIGNHRSGRRLAGRTCRQRGSAGSDAHRAEGRDRDRREHRHERLPASIQAQRARAGHRIDLMSKIARPSWRWKGPPLTSVAHDGACSSRLPRLTPCLDRGSLP